MSAALPTFHTLGAAPFVEALQIRGAIPLYDRTDRQIAYIESSVRKLGAQSFLVEERYVDRDYMDDHAAFYSSSLADPTNRTKRAHFFNVSAVQVEAEFARIRTVANKEGKKAYESECEKFSEAHYLGFMVVKPLPGCPVGRTVLRHFPTDQDGIRRNFACTRYYKAHVGGISLRVKGLCFQQQDVGVSACATTALWSAVSKASDFESIAVPTPADITTLASRYSLPHGRAMPSEGLSLDQMCQAVQGIGLAPALYNTSQFQIARSYLHMAALSGLSGVLILENSEGRHAVTLTGMLLKSPNTPASVIRGVVDASSELKSVYVHDDRYGPYLRADLVDDGTGPGILKLQLDGGAPEEWTITHFLVPLHQKIRLAFAGVSHAGVYLAKQLQRIRQAIPDFEENNPEGNPVTLKKTIELSSNYIESLLLEDPKLEPDDVWRLLQQTEFSRYVGVVSLVGKSFGRIDVVLDTTSTTKNVGIISVVPRGKEELGKRIAATLSEVCASAAA